MTWRIYLRTAETFHTSITVVFGLEKISLMKEKKHIKPWEGDNFAGYGYDHRILCS